MPIAAAIPAIASTAGGVIGNLAGAGDRDRSAAAQAAALEAIRGVQLPEIEQMKLALDKYQSAGKLTPEEEATINLGASKMEDISVDPRLRNAQLQSLEKLQQIGSGQLTAEDKAALAKLQRQTSRDAQARDASILQNMQERGIGGSGAELAARLSANQAASNREAQGGLDIQGQAAQRALQAISQAGAHGGSMERQQFGEQSQIANAADAIARYNAMNQQQILGQNIGARNQAKQYNLAQQQALMNANTD